MGGVLGRPPRRLRGAANEAVAGSESEPSRVKKFSSSAPWELHFNEIKETSKLLVVSWYEPCRMIDSAFRDMADKFTDVDFVKLDVDELPDVAKEFNVTEMPTFLLVKKGKEVERIVGAKTDEFGDKKDEFEMKVIKHMA